jgi:hypothetical protein
MAYLYEFADKVCKLTMYICTCGWYLITRNSHEVCMQTWQLVKVRKANLENNTGCYMLRGTG